MIREARMNDIKIQMIISDLDGTLLDNNHCLSQENIDVFRKLGDMNIIRVIATGRNYFSFNRVIPSDMPIDYLIFSSGAGIMEWKNKKIIHSEKLHATTVYTIAKHLRKSNINFMLQSPIPDNHYFVYSLESKPLPDFNRRLKLYKGYHKAIDWNNAGFGDASQFIVILPDDVDFFDRIRKKINGVKVIRATSPIDKKSIWMEIFPEQVSKANAINFLCRKLNIDQKETCSFGNDYNDIDMLKFTHYSFVVSDSPEKLKNQFRVIGSNEENGVAAEINKLIKRTLRF